MIVRFFFPLSDCFTDIVSENKLLQATPFMRLCINAEAFNAD